MARSLDITDRVSPLLRELAGFATSGELERAAEQGAVVVVRDHFFKLNAERPNQLGGRRTNFWTATGRSVSSNSQPGTVEININQVGFRQRLQGGWIRPTGGKKYLTIPAVAEAHGRRASEFSNLRFGFTENKYGNLQPALVEASATNLKFGRKRKDGSRKTNVTGHTGGRAIFFLSKQVFQQADPSVLPSEAAITDAAIKAVENAAAGIRARHEKGGA